MDDGINRSTAAENDIFGEELQQDNNVMEQNQDENDQGVVVTDMNDDSVEIENDGADD